MKSFSFIPECGADFCFFATEGMENEVPEPENFIGGCKHKSICRYEGHIAERRSKPQAEGGNMAIEKKHESTTSDCEVGLSELLDAEKILQKISYKMDKEYQNNGTTWPREWMRKHTNDRAAILKVRNLLLDRYTQRI